MKFFFPDSQDQIDPGFDFDTEERNPFRVRQRDDLYAHEALADRSYDGVLVSKPIVDGVHGAAGRYTLAQRHRIYRLGVRQFFRLDTAAGPRIDTMGDCGAFSYVGDEEPPYTVDEVIDFYDECGFDIGISVDHVILAYQAPLQAGLFPPEIDPDWSQRQKLTLELAADFLRRHSERRCRFTPVGVAQGWSPDSYAEAAGELQRMGYRRIALGGMVPLRTQQILDCVTAVNDIREPATQIHLLGVTRTEHVERFSKQGVTSFDSTGPFRRAFKDDRDNYWTVDRTYTAVRVPQVDGNPKLMRRIVAGQVDQANAVSLEQACMRGLAAYDRGKGGLDEVVESLREYEELWDGKINRSREYRELLEDRPWKICPCGICEEVGVHVALFRGTERNKRRGFHNVFVFNRKLQESLKGMEIGKYDAAGN